MVGLHGIPQYMEGQMCSPMFGNLPPLGYMFLECTCFTIIYYSVISKPDKVMDISPIVISVIQ